MPPDARIGDTHVGVCDHGEDCCPHDVSGVIVSGAGSVISSGSPTARMGDSVVHDCPHCGTGVCVGASPNVNAEGSAVHRLGDLVVYPAGDGTTVSGAGDVNIN